MTATAAWSGSRPVARALGDLSRITNTLGRGSPEAMAISSTTLQSLGSVSALTSLARLSDRIIAAPR